MAAMLRLYNTLTREKAPFAPIDPSRVRLYACGPTIYDAAHIGNARPIIVFDLLFRLLRHLYGPAHVVYARNVTDVDDKINARAAERGISIRELTDGTLEGFHEDLRALGVLMPEDVNVAGEPPRFVEPRATDHIAEMVALIESLIAAGHAYVAADHVLFDVPSMPDYGALSKRPLDEMEAGARVEVAPYKRSPLDFVLWKPSKPGEPAWRSPAGIAAPGRPGWHIECSAMSWKHLGETFDIHAGGLDLIFPHHENEVAQSRCCFGTPVMANVWLHNGFLQVEGEKMSKSLGNFVTLREVLKDWPGETVRLAMLRTHYRQPIDWTLKGLEESQKSLERWWRACGQAEADDGPDEGFVEALRDDLNTPRAIARLHDLRSEGRHGALAASLTWMGFPWDRYRPVQHLDVSQAVDAVTIASTHRTVVLDLERIEALMEQRHLARAAKDWASSDRLRAELDALGASVKDEKDGTSRWMPK
ncbi:MULTISPECIES: cysteine--tRNA ligase [Methylobacterium]|uniref:Cysteine--tRNA ligase n=1 Tax=Methylobacterium jeotgali TaxID=381630 RepID=A0ABQ4ST66_9HYPH|nr:MULTISPECIES: cysteine--tRNA ligase [Methylobacterium]PIU04392.1 MAG: cysteine--tRNA ligase [Methylobacterium sp. CG09_land_8_20_14_0_10_71_15]PIU13090.1 MAG: cysteine--tRNA ligase [Methylobacterium sp. CG08_land_8_20_14_0_20_71_15]GBU18382.1 cysteinyl-tRNA synthetase [Methylobacterium sp.]GJE04959.1 Cysteine--tRNA ligase [Methylobacterium jeotgali]